MNKSISLGVKVVAMLLLVGGMFLPLLSATFGTTWDGASPAGAPPDFEGTVWDLGIMSSTIYELTYDTVNNQYELIEVQGQTEVGQAFDQFSSIMMIFALVALGLFALATFLHTRGPSKFASFLMIVGAISIGLILFFMTLIQSTIISSLGGTGNTFSRQGSVISGDTTYTYTSTVTIAIGFGYYMLSGSIILAIVSLFLKVDHDEF